MGKMRDVKSVMNIGTSTWTLYKFVHVRVVARLLIYVIAMHTWIRGSRLALMSSMSIVRDTRDVPSSPMVGTEYTLEMKKTRVPK
jgi:hypothetical protein